MPATYICSACIASWKANGEPHACPSCGSRVIDRLERSQMFFDNPYGAPMAPLVESPVISSAAFTVTYWLGWVGIMIGVGLIAAGKEPEEPMFVAGWALALVSGCSLFASYIVSWVKLYKGWELIQPLRRMDWSESGMPTPATAVGFLFIPCFNLYWNFQAFHGFATRANKYTLRTGISTRPMNEGLSQAFCILRICEIVPVIQYFAVLANLIIYYMVVLDIDRIRSAIQTHQGDGFVEEIKEFHDEL